MILIDKPMPKDCDYCFCNDDYYRCGLLGDEFPLHLSGRLPDCPLREADVIEVGEWYEENQYKVFLKRELDDDYIKPHTGFCIQKVSEESDG